MPATPFSYRQYAGNGSNKNFAVPFSYLLKAHVKVYIGFNLLDGTYASELVDGTGFTWSSATQIQTTTAPTSLQTLTVIRKTPDSSQLVPWQDGSTLIASDLNTADLQNLYVVQEQQDRNDAGITQSTAAASAASAATTAANTATSTANTALSTANTALSNANTAVTTANTATTNASAAVTTANTASANASAAVTTANTASSTANTASTNASGAVTTANAAAATAATALSTANTAATNASTALSTANTASSNASAAVTTANTASTNASNAVTTANTASSNATTAVNTANTASTNASNAATTANTANTKADQAIAAVSNSINYTLVANVAAIPASPANNTYIEVADSTGLESFSPLTGRPAGFVGDSGLTSRLKYTTTGSTWQWLNYYANDSDARFLKKAGGTVSGNLAVTGTLTKGGSNVVTVGDTGTVTSTMLADGTIVNADISATAAIAGTKISPDFGSQNRTSTGTSTAASFIPTSSTVPTNGVYLPAANSVAISTGGSGRLFVASNGAVGVNTSSPAAGFDVNNTAYTRGGHKVSGYFATSAGDGYVINIGSSGTVNYIQSLNGATQSQLSIDGNPIVFRGASFAEIARFDTSGRLGVGTSTPSYAAHIVGAKNTSQLFIDAPTISAANDFTQLGFGLGGTAFGAVRLGFDNPSAVSNSYLGFWNNNGSGLVERIRVTSAGLVGIGTSSPGALLTVAGTSGSAVVNLLETGVRSWGIRAGGALTNTLDIADLTAGQTRLTIDSSGRLGIGTSSPQRELHVVGTGRFDNGAVDSIYTGTTAGSQLGIFRAYGTGSGVTGEVDIIGRLETGSLTNSYCAIQTTLSGVQYERFRIDSSGRVGIGSTSASQRLTIETTASGDGIRLFNNDSTSGSFTRIGFQSANNWDTSSVNAAIDAIKTGAGTGTNIRFLTAGEANTGSAGLYERARLTASGQWLLGTSSARSNFFNTSSIAPSFQVEGTTYGTSSISLIANGNTATVNPSAFLILGRTRGTSVGSTTVVSGGDVLGAVSYQGSDGTEFVEGASIACEVDGTPGANSMPGRIVLSTTAAGAASPTERFRITKEGYFLYGTTAKNITSPNNPGFEIHLQNTGGLGLYSNTTANNATCIVFQNPNGRVGFIDINANSVVYATSSDYRLKENVAPIADGITRLQQLKPSRFNFIPDPSKTVDGFLAHEVQDIVPEAITGEKDAVDADGNPKYQGIDQSKLVPLLTAALQEAIGEIESLKARLTAAGL